MLFCTSKLLATLFPILGISFLTFSFVYALKHQHWLRLGSSIIFWNPPAINPPRTLLFWTTECSESDILGFPSSSLNSFCFLPLEVSLHVGSPNHLRLSDCEEAQSSHVERPHGDTVKHYTCAWWPRAPSRPVQLTAECQWVSDPNQNHLK